MSDKREDLSELVRRVIWQKDLTYRDIEARASRAGKTISAATVGQIVNKKSGKILPSTLDALAAGLGESKDYLYGLVYGAGKESEKIKDGRFAAISSLYETLSELDQVRIEPVLEMIQMYLERLTSGNRMPKNQLELLETTLNQLVLRRKNAEGEYAEFLDASIRHLKVAIGKHNVRRDLERQPRRQSK